MTFTRRKDSWAVTLSRYLAIAIGLVTPVLAAHAQAVPPPVRSFIDANGIDLTTGTFYTSDVQVSIGVPGQGGLARAYFSGGEAYLPWGQDNFTGTLNKNIAGTIYTASLGQMSVNFSLSGSTFTNMSGDGSTLTLTNSTTYTYVTRDGTNAIFSTTWGGGCCALANVARVTTITRPNGEVLTFWYSTHTVVVNPTTNLLINRLEAVTNNFGYEIKYFYQHTEFGYEDAYLVSQITAINNAIDYCAPTATTCSFSQTWPSINISVPTGYVNTDEAPTYVTDNLGRQTTYPHIPEYNTTTSLVRPSGETFTLTYDASTRVTQFSNGTGTWHYNYVTSGSTLTTTVTDPNAHTRVVVVNTTNSTVTSDTDGLSHTTSYAYDTQGRLHTITDPYSILTTYTYDTRGNVTSVVVTGADHVTTLTTSASFDSACTAPAKCNKPNSTTDANGNQTDYTYSTATGQLATAILPVGANGLRPETDYTYTSLYAWYKNSAGTIVQAPSPVSLLTLVSRCSTAQTCAGTANAVQTTINYGSAGVANNRLPMSKTQGSGDGALSATIAVTYDSVGNTLTQQDPLLNTTRFRYDVARQLIGVVGSDPDGGGPLHNRAIRITYECDATVKSGCDGLATLVEQGTVLSQSDADWAGFSSLGQVARSYDGIDRKVVERVTNGSTSIGVAQFAYDPANRLQCTAIRMNPSALSSLPPSACTLGTSGSAGDDRITAFTYDSADNLLKRTVGYGTTTPVDEVTFTYGLNNEVSTQADGKGNLTTFNHDTFNRTVKIRFPNTSGGGSSTTDFEQYTLDNNGNITADRRRDGTSISYGYDHLNLRTSGFNGSTFGYDNLGRMTSAAMSGNSQTFGYDALNRQTSESGPVGTVSRKFDLAGNMTRLTYPDSYYVIYAYDFANELTGLTDSNAVSLLQEAYDNLGRLTSITRASASGLAESRTYGADLRLAIQQYTFTDTTKNVKYTYTWNLAGQPMSMTPDNSVYSNTTSPAATSYATDGQNRYTTVGGQTMTYDGRSNLTNDGTNSYTFDGLNRATAVNSTPLSYDALDRLATMISGSTTIRFLFSGQQMVGAYDVSGNLFARYVPNLGLDQNVLFYSGSSTAISNATWPVTNAFGSVVAGSAATVGITTYDAYGVSPGLSAQNGGMGFKGMQVLNIAAVYSARARAYDAKLGRFLQSDPIGYADGPNYYAFAHNSPVNGADPTGLCGLTKTHIPGSGDGVAYTQDENGNWVGGTAVNQGQYEYSFFFADCFGPSKPPPSTQPGGATGGDTGHEYGVSTPTECTPAEAFNAVRALSAPGAPVNTREGLTTAIPLWHIFSPNIIDQIVDTPHMTLTNIAHPGHIFQGTVVNTVTPYGPGSMVTAEGTGVPGESAAWGVVNDVIGSLLFSVRNSMIADICRANRGELNYSDLR